VDFLIAFAFALLAWTVGSAHPALDHPVMVAPRLGLFAEAFFAV